MNQVGYDMLYLSVCALNGDIPDATRIAAIDLDALYDLCRAQSLVAMVCMALESAGVALPHKWIEAKSKAIRKNILLDAERQAILAHMEENGIRYMPLKGAILKDCYPKLGMRQMSDNDILIDRDYRRQMTDFMIQRGYTVKDVGTGHDDSYIKAPVYHFELHVQLFCAEDGAAFSDYADRIRHRLIRDKDNRFGYHMSDEDFYVYMIAHGYKHYIGNGIGARLLLDCLVYLRAKGESMDWSDVRQELASLGITEYEQQLRRLAQKLADDPEGRQFSPAEHALLEEYLASGTFGNAQIATENRLRKLQNRSPKFVRLRYLWHRAFPDMTFYQTHYPFYYRRKWLLPLAWCIRCFRWLGPRNKQLRKELNDVRKWNR